jgi:hypothetical protein
MPEILLPRNAAISNQIAASAERHAMPSRYALGIIALLGAGY